MRNRRFGQGSHRLGIVTIALILLALACALAYSNDRGPHSWRRHNVWYENRGVHLDPAEQKVRNIMIKWLKDGHRTPYSGVQITQIMHHGFLESKQIAMHGGPGQMRIQFISPPKLAGELFLITDGRFFHYIPSQNVIHQGEIPHDEFEHRMREIMESFLDGRISIQLVGKDRIAERNCSILEIKPKGKGYYKRVWIDSSTGIRLKIEKFSSSSRPIFNTFFTKIQLWPHFPPNTFNPYALPKVRHIAILPHALPYTTIGAAQDVVRYPIREPHLPSGYRNVGIWILARNDPFSTTALRYSNGVSSFVLFERPLPPPQWDDYQGPEPASKIRLRNNVAYWRSQRYQFTLIGDLSESDLLVVVRSLL
ncbi:MAG: hypothetical protein M1330_01615 [Armatimonadetes bacterium]|nr:hypothetical protein [Armatimonadota bacterium]